MLSNVLYAVKWIYETNKKLHGHLQIKHKDCANKSTDFKKSKVRRTNNNKIIIEKTATSLNKKGHICLILDISDISKLAKPHFIVKIVILCPPTKVIVATVLGKNSKGFKLFFIIWWTILRSELQTFLNTDNQLIEHEIYELCIKNNHK